MRRSGRHVVMALLFAAAAAPCAAFGQAEPPPLPESDALPSAEPLPEAAPAKSEGFSFGKPFESKVSQILTHADAHKWERHVRGFRRDHNFALVSGLSSGAWKVRWEDDTEASSYSNSGIYTRFQYSFHLQLYRGFGYILGSGVGYFYESADRRQDFRPVSAWQYPGILVGLTLNVNPVLRLSTAFESYPERHGGIERRLDDGETSQIYVTTQAYDGGFYADIFYDLSWAVRLEAHRRHVEYLAPLGASGYPVHARLHRDDRLIGVGIVYHLL